MHKPLAFTFLVVVMLFAVQCTPTKIQCWNGSIVDSIEQCPERPEPTPQITPSEPSLDVPQIEPVQEEVPSKVKHAANIVILAEDRAGIPTLRTKDVAYHNDSTGRISKHYRAGLQNRVWMDIVEFDRPIEGDIISLSEETFSYIKKSLDLQRKSNPYRANAAALVVANKEHIIADTAEQMKDDELEFVRFNIDVFEATKAPDPYGNVGDAFISASRYYAYQRVLFCAPNILISLTKDLGLKYDETGMVTAYSVDTLPQREIDNAKNKIISDRRSMTELVEIFREACDSAALTDDELDFSNLYTGEPQQDYWKVGTEIEAGMVLEEIPSTIPALNITNKLIDETSGEYEFFFTIHNTQETKFVGFIELALYDTAGKKISFDTFRYDQKPIYSGRESLVSLKSHLPPAPLSLNTGVQSYSFRVLKEGKAVQEGSGPVTSNVRQ